MKSKNSWVLAGLVGLLFVVVPLLSAVITATGAFGADPSERVNRVDFVWAAIGLVIAVYSFYHIRQLSKS